MSVISYATAREVASIRVGDHPQRMRMGPIRSLPEQGGAAPVPAEGGTAQARPGARLRVRLSEPARLRIKVQRKSKGRYRRVRVVHRRARQGTRRKRLGKYRRAGRYRLVVRARDAAGNRSAKRYVRFRVRRPR